MEIKMLIALWYITCVRTEECYIKAGAVSENNLTRMAWQMIDKQGLSLNR
jgi:hypothetical protein